MTRPTHPVTHTNNNHAAQLFALVEQRWNEDARQTALDKLAEVLGDMHELAYRGKNPDRLSRADDLLERALLLVEEIGRVSS